MTRFDAARSVGALTRSRAGQFICVLAVAFAVAVLTSATSLRAEDAVWPRHFACTFGQGTTWAFDAGKPTSKAAEPLQFEIDEIDLDAKKARLVVKAGETGLLQIIRALNANHFLEGTREGFLNITTIYDASGTSSVYPAVHSRHQGVLGEPIFAQYAGTCTAKTAH